MKLNAARNLLEDLDQTPTVDLFDEPFLGSFFELTEEAFLLFFLFSLRFLPVRAAELRLTCRKCRNRLPTSSKQK